MPAKPTKPTPTPRLILRARADGLASGLDNRLYEAQVHILDALDRTDKLTTTYKEFVTPAAIKKLKKLCKALTEMQEPIITARRLAEEIKNTVH